MAAISHGELSASVISVDARMGKPGWRNVQSPLSEYIAQLEVSGGTETSKYLEEKIFC